MSPLSMLSYITRGEKIRKAFSLRYSTDADYLELFSRVIASNHIPPDELFTALEKGILLEWEDTSDIVNPFGDRRGIAFDSVWTFNLDRDVLSLTKNDGSCSVPLSLARERALTTDDFELVQSTGEPDLPEQSLPGPYWEPRIDPDGRERSFLGQILQDFSHTWRHVLRRHMNTTTFLKLAYAISWLAQLQFTLSERTGFEHISDGGPYVYVTDLPCWESPRERLVPTESSLCWFVISEDIQEGLRMVRNHTRSQQSSCYPSYDFIYLVTTVRQVVLCKASGDGLVWTQPEKLFNGGPASDTAIDMLLWAASISRPGNEPTPIHKLPLEIQDKILQDATTSLVAAAKLGCELSLGSSFSWLDQGVKVGIETNKRHRGESSPVESHIVLNGVKSGLSYKREAGYGAIRLPPGRTAAPAPAKRTT